MVQPFCSIGRALSIALSDGTEADRCEQLSGSPDNGTHGLQCWPWPQTAPLRGCQRLCHRYSGLSTDRTDASYIIPVANNPSNDSTSSDDEGASNLSPHDDEVVQPPSPPESHTEVVLDMVISEFTKLLTEYPSYYKEISLPDTTRKMLVPIVQEMFKQLTWYDPLEQPNRKMEVVSKLKYILLDDGSTSSPYAGLLIELVVGPIMKWLKETWAPTRFW